MAIRETGPGPSQNRLIDADEIATVAAICNRVSRMLGLVDREGLKRDIAIVHAIKPFNLEALAGAPDAVFVKELCKIVEAADRDTETLQDYSSFMTLADTPFIGL